MHVDDIFRAIGSFAVRFRWVVLIAYTVLYLFNVHRAVHYIPLKSDAFGDGFAAMLINGVLAAAGLVMIVPLFIPSRWRRPVRPETPWTPAESSSLLSDWTETAPISPQQGPQPSTDPPPW